MPICYVYVCTHAYFLRRKYGSNLGLCKTFLEMTPKAHMKNKKIDKWDFTKIKNICVSKDTINKEKTAYTMGENICKSCIWQGICI
jgi:hypothetical protein